MSDLFAYAVGLLSGASLATAVIYDYSVEVSRIHALILLAIILVANALLTYKNV